MLHTDVEVLHKEYIHITTDNEDQTVFLMLAVEDQDAEIDLVETRIMNKSQVNALIEALQEAKEALENEKEI